MFQRMMFNVLLWVFDMETGAVFTSLTPIIDLVCDYFLVLDVSAKTRHVYNAIQGAIHFA